MHCMVREQSEDDQETGGRQVTTSTQPHSDDPHQHYVNDQAPPSVSFTSPSLMKSVRVLSSSVKFGSL